MDDDYDPFHRTTEEMKAQHREFGMDYGSLLWIRSNRRAINVPLNLLTDDQRQKLEHYLKHGDLLSVNRNRARLAWEYANQTDGGYLVEVIELTKEQRDALDPPKRRVGAPSFRRVDFNELREKLLAGRIGWRDVFTTFESMTYRPWATKEWKERRDSKIKEKCASCGSTTGPMVLQHTRQPRKPKTILSDMEKANREGLRTWLAAHQPRLDLSKEAKTADACPRCGSQVIGYRWTLETWVCAAVSAGVRCGYRFREPVKQVPNAVIRKRWDAAIAEEKARFLNETGLGRQAALTAVDEMIRYLAMLDTKTLCKPCAFVEDKLR